MEMTERIDSALTYFSFCILYKKPQRLNIKILTVFLKSFPRTISENTFIGDVSGLRNSIWPDGNPITET